MPTFKDSAGREWLLSLDAPTIRLVRQKLDIDLVELNGSAYQKLADDPCLLVDCLWVLCREQATDKGVTETQFAKGLVGDAIERATAAMLESIADFFPSHRRKLVTTVAAKNQALRTLAIEQALSKLDDETLIPKVLAGLEARMDDEISRALTRSMSVTSLPASAESAPAD